ncbi:MAG TPA: hypothetical protein VNM90_21460, partial [Haliangium sp.]|nr:hypothetical protein [Haliangium sp.]
LERVKERLFAEYPGYPLERFVEIGLPAVWDRLVARQNGEAGTAGETGAAGEGPAKPGAEPANPGTEPAKPGTDQAPK